MSKKLSAVFIFFAGVFWGTSGLFVNLLTDCGFTSVECAAIRLVLATPLLHAVLLISNKGYQRFSLKAVLWCVCTGIFSTLALSISYYYAIKETSAAVAAVLLYTAPAFVMIMSAVFFKEKITKKKTASLVCCVVGCALAVGIVGGMSFSVPGIIAGLIAGFTYSLYSILAVFAMKAGALPMTVSTYGFTAAAIGILFFASPARIVSVVSSSENKPYVIVLMLLCALVTSVFPYVLYTLGLKKTESGKASIIASVEPVTAAVLGFTVLHQKADVFQVIGILFVLTAIVILNTGKEKTEQK